MESLQDRLEDLQDLQKQLDRQNRVLRRRARNLNDNRPEVRIETHPRYSIPERKNNLQIVPVLPAYAGNGRDNPPAVTDTVYQYDTVYTSKLPFDTAAAARPPASLARDTVRIVDTVKAKPAARLTDLPAIKIYFGTSSASIDQRYYSELDFVASSLNQNDAYNVEISGYTDDSGPAEFNLRLSQNRANAVKQYLVDKGISEERLITKFYGEDASQSRDSQMNSRTLNRKVEIRFVEKGSLLSD